MANPYLTPEEDALVAKGRVPDAPPAAKPSSLLRRAGDLGIAAVQGVAELPNVVLGLGDLVSGGAVGKAAEDLGYDSKAAAKFYTPLMTPETQAAQKKVEEAKGFTDTLLTALENPSAIGTTVARSLPSMVGGGLLGRAAAKGIPALAKWGGAIGEGSVQGGTAAEDIRSNSETGYITPKQALLAAGGGLVTGGIGRMSQGLAASKGIRDVDAWLAGADPVTGAAKSPGLAKRVLTGMGTEGAEELAQAPGETISQNLAEGKKWDEGLGGNMAMSLLAGAAMGAGANIAGKKQAVLDKLQTPTPPEQTNTEAVLGGTPVEELPEIKRLLESAGVDLAPEEIVTPATPEPVADAENMGAAPAALTPEEQAAMLEALNTSEGGTPNAQVQEVRGAEAQEVAQDYAARPIEEVHNEANLRGRNDASYLAIEQRVSDENPNLPMSQVRRMALQEHDASGYQAPAADPNAQMTPAEQDAWEQLDYAGRNAAYDAVRAEMPQAGNNEVAREAMRRMQQAPATPPTPPTPPDINALQALYPAEWAALRPQYPAMIDRAAEIQRRLDAGELAPETAAPLTPQEEAELSDIGRNNPGDYDRVRQVLQVNATAAGSNLSELALRRAVIEQFRNPPLEYLRNQSPLTPEENERANNIGATQAGRDILDDIDAEIVAEIEGIGRSPIQFTNASAREILRRYDERNPAAQDTPEQAYRAFESEIDSGIAPPPGVIDSAAMHFFAMGQNDPNIAARQLQHSEDVRADMEYEGTPPEDNREEFQRRVMERYIREQQAEAERVAIAANHLGALSQAIMNGETLLDVNPNIPDFRITTYPFTGFYHVYDARDGRLVAHGFTDLAAATAEAESFQRIGQQPAVQATPSATPWYEDMTEMTAEELARFGALLTADVQAVEDMRVEVADELSAMGRAVLRRIMNREVLYRLEAQQNTPSVPTALDISRTALTTDQENIDDDLQNIFPTQYRDVYNFVAAAYRAEGLDPTLNSLQAAVTREIANEFNQRHPVLYAESVYRQTALPVQAAAAINVANAPPSAAPTVDLELTAPTNMQELTQSSLSYPTTESFIRWLYGENINQPSVLTSFNSIYTGPINDRITNASNWPVSAHRDRIVSLLRAVAAGGYRDLQEVHQGVDPNNRPVVQVYRLPIVPQPAYDPDAINAIISPVTQAEITEATELSTKAQSLSRDMAGDTTTRSNNTLTAWKNALEGVYTSIANKVDRFRYGTSSATTIQGVLDDLNAHQRSIGSDMEIENRGNGNNLELFVRHTRGYNQWFFSVRSNPGGSYAMDHYSPTDLVAGREAGDGGFAYYAVHLIAHKVQAARYASSGMTTVNQIRRLENAFSFLARYGITGSDNGDVRIESRIPGTGQYYSVANGISPLSSIALSSYSRIAHAYKELTRFKFDFTTGKVSTIGGVEVPISAITGHARTINPSTGIGASTHEALVHVADSGASLQGLSDSTLLRALITQEVLRTSTQAGVPGSRKLTAITSRIATSRGYPDLIFYNRTTLKPASNLKAGKLTEALAPVIKGLKNIVPIKIIQSQENLPGWTADQPSFNAVYLNGTIYVVADQVHSIDEAKTLILDHELRHHGLRGVLGNKFNTIMQQVWYSKSNGVKDFAHVNGIDVSTKEGRLEAAEEFVVSLAKEAKATPTVDRIVAALRSALRALGFNLTLSTRELRALVARAGEAKALKAATAATPETIRYMRTPLEQIKVNKEDMDSLGGWLKSTWRGASNQAVKWLAPVDRAIDLAVSRPEYAPIAKGLKGLRTLFHSMQAIQDTIVSDAGKLWEKTMEQLKSKEDLARFNNTMSSATLWGLSTTKTLEDQQWTEEEWQAAKMPAKADGMTLAQAHDKLMSMYDAMSVEQRTMYQRLLQSEKDVRNQLREAMVKFAAKAYQGDELIEETKKINKKFSALKGDYFPLSRFGDHVVEVIEGEETTRSERWHFESLAEAEAKVAEVNALPGFRARYSYDGGRTANTRGEAPSEFITKFTAAMAASGIEGDQLNLLKDDIARIWVSLSPESSSLRHSVQRKGIKGFDNDMLRGFVTYSQRHARSIAFLSKGTEIRQAFVDMQNTVKAAADEGTSPPSAIQDMTQTINQLKQHDIITRSEKISPVVQNLSKIPFIWYLFSPSVFMVQTAQPFMLSVPKMAAKFGYTKAAKMVLEHYRRQTGKVGTGPGSDWAYSIDRIDAHRINAEKLGKLQDERDSWPATSNEYAEAERKIQNILSTIPESDRMLLAMKMAANKGAIEITMTHEAYSIMTNDVNNPSSKASKWMMDKAGYFMRTSELASRKATFAAAFALEFEKSGDFQKATNYGVEVVQDTLYDYSSSNRSLILTGNTGRLFGQFQIFRMHTMFKIAQLAQDSYLKKYDKFKKLAAIEAGQKTAAYKTEAATMPQAKQAQLDELAAKHGVSTKEYTDAVAALDKEKAEARKELGFMLASTAALSGASGLPMVGTALAALTFLGMIGGDDDEPWNAEMEFNKMLRSVPGGNVALKGLPALLGWDVSRRVGMQGIFDVFQGEPPANLKGNQLAAYYAWKFTGPIGGVGGDLFKMRQAFIDGDMNQVLSLSSPKIVKDMAKGYGMLAGEGVKSANGKLLVPADRISVYEAVLQFVGLNPMEMSLAQEKNSATAKMSTRIADRKGQLSRRFQEAVASQDVDRINDARDAVVEFNQKMPEFGFKASELASSVKQALKKELGIEGKNEMLVKRKYGI